MNPIELSDRLWHFAARIGKVVDALPESSQGRHVANQLIRSGTSAAPNYDEGRVGESRADFVHKLKVALKELVETRGWLKYVTLAELLPARKIAPLQDECEQLCKIITSSTMTATKNLKTRAQRARKIRDRQSSIVNHQFPQRTPERGV